MDSDSDNLEQGLKRLELRLRHDWAEDAPPLSPELNSYRNEWLRTLNAPNRTASANEVRTALLKANPVLVGDFHTMRRPRHSLTWILRQVPEHTQPGLLLELMPQCAAIPAAEILNNNNYKLVDGRQVNQVYQSSLVAMAARRGLVVGAWVEAGARDRDTIAAEKWAEMRKSHPQHKWILFFGDWHLADSHLPKELRKLGAHPQVLHQSPEPLWDRLPGQVDNQLLKISPGHWAWLHTPPLAHWASSLQAMNNGDHDVAAEITEELVEILVVQLCELFKLPQPSTPVAPWPEDMWKGFHATLPDSDRKAFSPDVNPAGLVIHPHLPAVYATSTPSLNQLVEAAAHCISCDYPISQKNDLGQRLAARAFRRLPACLLNPFLKPPKLSESEHRLFGNQHPSSRPGDWAKLLAGWQSGRAQNLSPADQIIAIEVFGAQAGGILARKPNLQLKFINELLKNGFQCLDWSALAASMRAA